MLIIRKAKKSDSKDLIEVNINTWNTTYKGIIPDEYLKHRVDTIEEEIKKCEDTIEQQDNTYVAVLDGKIVGVMNYGSSRIENFKNYGEVYSLYVLKDYQRIEYRKKIIASRFQIFKTKVL